MAPARSIGREDKSVRPYTYGILTCHTICNTVAPLSEVITVRVPRELKKRMKRFENGWSEEIRAFIEERVRQLELMELIEEIASDPRRPVVKGDSTPLIREDRER